MGAIRKLVLSKIACNAILFLTTLKVGAQEGSTPDDRKRHKSGLFIAFGGQALFDVDYRYLFYLLQAKIQYLMRRKGDWRFHAFVQPQVWLTRFNFEDDGPADIRRQEFGIGLGLQGERSFSQDRYSLYMGVGTGPCFLSKGTLRQTGRLAFNSHLFRGLSLHLNKAYDLDIRTGYRHVSNTGLSQPNGGLNNSMLSVGVFRGF